MNTIAVVKTHSYHISINLVINKNYSVQKLYSLDTGADQNCIIEEIYPTKYLEKSAVWLFSATGEKLKINYKIHKGYICNYGIYFINDIVITKDINEEIILGTPFMTQLKSYAATLDGIHTTIVGKRLSFHI